MRNNFDANREHLMPAGEPTIVDLFCGCGGLGLGAELAGFHSIAAIDVDDTLQSAYRLNFPNTRTFKADISEIDAEAWRFMLGHERPDGIVGGPPCQGFSRIGKRDNSDPRNSLIGHFFRHIALLSPKFFLMENVEGLLDEDKICHLERALELIQKNYSIIGPIIVDASDYGAPTKRRRVVVLGYRPDEIAPITKHDLFPLKTTPSVNVRDAIADLPPPCMHSGAGEYVWRRYADVGMPSSQLSAYASLMRRLPDRKIGWETALAQLAHGFVSGYGETCHSEAVKDRFALTLPGEVESVSRYPRLSWDGHCPTLRAGTGKERGSFQAMRPIHPASPRVITVREAARLQGFPDWFTFHPTKWHSFRMIGNSVSPVISRHLMAIIGAKLGAAIDTAQDVV